MRQAIVAGQFYPADEKVLRMQVMDFVIKKPNKDIIGAVVPHAGYNFSGKCAGEVYGVLPDAETYVILGVNHNSIGEDIAISLEDFETPLGIVKNDVKLGKEILKILKIDEDKKAHAYEHSIEVQLPFLQESQEHVRIVPIILKNYDFNVCEKLAKAIYKASEELAKKIIVIASSDFTHTGPSYNSFQDIKIDKKAIDEIVKLHGKKFIELAKTTTICGAGAITTTIELVKLLGAKKGKLLKYYDSSSVMPSENKVGYGGVVFL